LEVERTCGGDRRSVAHDPDRTSSGNLFCVARVLFNHLVGDGEQSRRHFDAERLCRLQVDDELESLGSITGKSAGFSPLRMRLLRSQRHGESICLDARERAM
jgi:hypothetical protein